MSCMKFLKKSVKLGTKSWVFLRNFRRNSQEILGKNSGEILRNFSKLSLNTMNPKKSLKLGINSGEFFENFREIIHKNLFSKNSSEILQSKSPKLENLRKFLTFVTWAMFKLYKNGLTKNFFFYEISYIWNVLSINFLFYEIFCLWNVLSLKFLSYEFLIPFLF